MKMNTYILAFVTKIMKAHSGLIKLNINLTKLNIGNSGMIYMYV